MIDEFENNTLEHVKVVNHILKKTKRETNGNKDEAYIINEI